MRIVDLLVQSPCRNEKIKGCFKGLLGIVEKGIKAIPAGSSQSTGGVYEAGKGHGHNFVRGVYKGQLIHLIAHGVIQVLVIPNTCAEAADPAQIGLYVGAPLSLGPRRAAHLEADGGIGRKGGGATGRRGIERITAGIRANTIVVHLVKVVVFVARGRLLFCRTAHTPTGGPQFMGLKAP